MRLQKQLSPAKAARRGTIRVHNNPNATSTTVARAFSLLDILSVQGAVGLGLTDVAKQLRMSRSTTHRYLVTLERLGAVERDDRDHFHLGLKMLELAGFTLNQNDLHNQSRAFLEELADQTHETIHLAVPAGTEVIYVAKVDSPRSLRMFSYIGARVPMYCTALGKAMLAFSNPELVNQVVRAGLAPRTPNTITSRHTLETELAKVRTRGYAFDSEENEIGVGCIGAPIFDYSARVVGAISVSGPAARMTSARQHALGPLVRDVGLRLSKRFGYSR